jgi:hypothetical protein
MECLGLAGRAPGRARRAQPQPGFCAIRTLTLISVPRSAARFSGTRRVGAPCSARPSRSNADAGARHCHALPPRVSAGESCGMLCPPGPSCVNVSETRNSRLAEVVQRRRDPVSARDSAVRCARRRAAAREDTAAKLYVSLRVDSTAAGLAEILRPTIRAPASAAEALYSARRDRCRRATSPER